MYLGPAPNVPWVLLPASARHNLAVHRTGTASVFVKMAQLSAVMRRRMEGDDATDFSTEWDSANVGYAIAVSIGAGLATGLGGALVFFPTFFKSIPQSTVLGISLALSAGVMLYVSFIEIFAKSRDAISQVDGVNKGGATAITTVPSPTPTPTPTLALTLTASLTLTPTLSRCASSSECSSASGSKAS